VKVFNERSVHPSQCVYNTCVEVYLQTKMAHESTHRHMHLSDMNTYFCDLTKQQLGNVWSIEMLPLMEEFYTSMRIYEDRQEAETHRQQQQQQHGQQRSRWIMPLNPATTAASLTTSLQMLNDDAWSTLNDRCTAVMESLNSLCVHLVSYAIATPLAKLLTDIFRLMMQTTQLLLPPRAHSEQDKEYQQLVIKFQDVLQALRDVLAALLVPHQL
jgi:hypothetical protein